MIIHARVSLSIKTCEKVNEMKFWTLDKRGKTRELASFRGDMRLRIYRTFMLKGGFHAATADTGRAERAGEGWKLRLISISARQNPPPIDGRGANPTGVRRRFHEIQFKTNLIYLSVNLI